MPKCRRTTGLIELPPPRLVALPSFNMRTYQRPWSTCCRAGCGDSQESKCRRRLLHISLSSWKPYIAHSLHSAHPNCPPLHRRDFDNRLSLASSLWHKFRTYVFWTLKIFLGTTNSLRWCMGLWQHSAPTGRRTGCLHVVLIRVVVRPVNSIVISCHKVKL
jgi:hypothetical protein